MKCRQKPILSGLSLLAGSLLLVACAGSGPASTPPTAGPQGTPQQPAAKTVPTAIADLGGGTTGPTSGGTGPNPTSAAATPAARPSPRATPVRAPGAELEDVVLSVTGQVWDVAASAQVIEFLEPVHGIDAAAVDDKTTITTAEGKRVELSEIKPGMVVQTSGTPDGHGAVLATSVRILTAPSPMPTAKPSPN